LYSSCRFVRFAAPKEAQEAINKLSGQRISNKVLLCKLSNSSPNVVTPELSTNLYIKPLLPSTKEGLLFFFFFSFINTPIDLLLDDLREIFVKFGPIAALKVMVDKVTGESRQIGFVRY
jgi:RNA recognition motif-containing protein